MVILGIDPSLTGTGLAVIETNGLEIACIRAFVVKTYPTNLRWMRFKRMTSISSVISKLILEYGIEYVSIEGFSLGSTGRASSDLPELGGMIRKTVYDLGVDFVEIPPTSLKKRITGRGNCYDKDLIIDGVNSILGVNIEKNSVNHNAADAIGLGFFLAELLLKNNDITAIKNELSHNEKKKKLKNKGAKKSKIKDSVDIVEIPLRKNNDEV